MDCAARIFGIGVLGLGVLFVQPLEAARLLASRQGVSAYVADVSDADAQWLFENFSDEALGELERRYAGLVRAFASCRAQREANSGDGG